MIEEVSVQCLPEWTFFKMMNGIFQNDEIRKISEHSVYLPDAGSTEMLVIATTKNNLRRVREVTLRMDIIQKTNTKQLHSVC